MTVRKPNPGYTASVDDRIASAALELLRSRGPNAVSVESVASSSGVAKTTIYRRFANRDALLTAAVTSAATAIPIPDGLTAKDTVRWVLRHARDTIDDVVGRGTVAAVMSDADPTFTELLLGMIRTTTRPFRQDLRDRALKGEIRADLDIELVISILLGVVVAEMIRGRPTDDAWVESVIEVLWPALSGPES